MATLTECTFTDITTHKETISLVWYRSPTVLRCHLAATHFSNVVRKADPSFTREISSGIHFFQESEGIFLVTPQFFTSYRVCMLTLLINSFDNLNC